jgi:hypothetical protein
MCSLCSLWLKSFLRLRKTAGGLTAKCKVKILVMRTLIQTF